MGTEFFPWSLRPHLPGDIYCYLASFCHPQSALFVISHPPEASVLPPRLEGRGVGRGGGTLSQAATPHGPLHGQVPLRWHLSGECVWAGNRGPGSRPLSLLFRFMIRARLPMCVQSHKTWVSRGGLLLLPQWRLPGLLFLPDAMGLTDQAGKPRGNCTQF